MKRKIRRKISEIAPDEIFLDTHNSPDFNVQQFEGRIEKALSKRVVWVFIAFFMLVIVLFSWKLFDLQIANGSDHYDRSVRNTLKNEITFADRGVVYDRDGVELAWNEWEPDVGAVFGVEVPKKDFAVRAFTQKPGFAHVLGYINYPAKDSAGFYWQTEYEGVEGVERVYNDELNGINGAIVTERNALGEVVTFNVVEEPVHGENISLSLDALIQEKLQLAISEIVEDQEYVGGTGIIMDVETGDLLALTNYPEYDSHVLTNKTNNEVLSGYFRDEGKPFLNRAVEGLYSPGSTVKPFIALGALTEGVVTEQSVVRSTGELKVQSPYDPEVYTIFRDWKEGGHGWVDVRKAIAESVNTYFYAISGGHEDVKGMGIRNIDKYMSAFKVGEPSNLTLDTELSGTIPNPEWKERTFDGDIWRLGDTYNTSIGQYGFLATPLQMVRAMSALVNGGNVLTPKIRIDEPVEVERIDIAFNEDHLEAVRDGMRRVITQGTGQIANVSYVDIAAKTGTAQTGVRNSQIHSWSLGFFPYEEPKYAFVILLERGPKEVTKSATFALRGFLDSVYLEDPNFYLFDSIDQSE